MAVPATPTGLTATALGDTSIRLAWTDASDDEMGFRVYRSPDGLSGWVNVGSTLAGIATWDDTGLDAGTTYYYWVLAYNYFGDSPSSNTASATTTGGQEGSMATITKVSPLRETRQGGLVTIAGTGFGASQSTGTVTVGAKALTNITWNDTSITGKLASDCPYGAQDVVVTPAAGTAVTWSKGVYCYDATEQYDATAIKVGKPEVSIDGVHVGFLHGPVNLNEQVRTLESRAPDRTAVIATFLMERTGELVFALKQFSGALLAIAVGGTYDSATKVLTVTDNGSIAEHSVCVVDASGLVWMFPRVQFVSGMRTTLDIGEEMVIPMTGRALSLDDDSHNLYRIQFPA